MEGTTSQQPESITPNDETKSAKPSMARARAEARRRRILEKSKDRMSVVSGEVTTTSTIVKEVQETNNAAVASDDTAAYDAVAYAAVSDNKKKQEDSNEENNNNDDNAPVAEGTTITSPTSKGSARLAQMRRRRYKKAAIVAETSTAKSEHIPEDESKPESNNEKEGENNAEVVQQEAEKPQEEKEVTEKKKYMGVVKMRRKMLAEKKASEAQQQNTAIKAVTAKRISKMKKEKKVVTLGPIVVQLLTVVLLFLAGFDVGMQNHVVVKQDVPSIHGNFSISDHGIGALKLVGMNAPMQQTGENIAQNVFTLNEPDEEEFGQVKEEEEFAEPKPVGASSTSEREPNIDPVFGVDFDELTAGEGILMACVRFAVSIHRLLTYFFFTMPLAFISGLFTLPKKILVNPPILFLCAVIIRCLGKYVLNGSLPDLDEMLKAEINESDAMKGKDSVADTIGKANLFSMGTNFAKTFFKKHFPKVVFLFSIFKDAKSDMFVVFCGFFFGLVAPSGLLGHLGHSIPESSISEEL